MAGIFINYRREDSGAYAGRVCDRLKQDFPEHDVFMDIDAIDPGDDFVDVIQQRLQSCHAVVVVIGRAWTTCVDDAGERRLDNEDDYVRRELVAALTRKIRVIPVLVSGASMPRTINLPGDIASLARRNALEVSDLRFHADVDRLVETLGRALAVSGEVQAKPVEVERTTDAPVPPAASVNESAPSRMPDPSRAAPQGTSPVIGTVAWGLLAIGVVIAIVVAIRYGDIQRDESVPVEVKVPPNDEQRLSGDEQSLSTIRQAAERGDAGSQVSLGYLYLSGRGVTQSDVEAVLWYRKAAEQGHPLGLRNLGLMLRDGRGAPRNDAEAIELFRKAAEQGYSDAQVDLGSMYLSGRGIAQSDAEALQWYRKAAEQGNAYGQNNVGAMLRDGRGAVKNDAAAVDWFRKSAKQNFTEAQMNLGFMYEAGRGVKQNDAEAARLYRIAADKGEVHAQYNLARALRDGRGVARNDAEAVKLFRKAAAQAHFEAGTELDAMIADGRGVAGQ